MHSLENLSFPCNHELKFSQNTQDLMKWYENLNYPYYHELKFLLSHFCWTELKNCCCYYELKFLLKKQFWCHLNFWTGPIIKSWKFCENRQFWWCHSKVWPAPIITSWNFSQNKAVLMISLESLNWTYYYEATFSQK